MKFTFVFLLLLDIPHLRGQQETEELEHILLRFAFPPFYNRHNKSCCKLYPGGCYKLMDSEGYTCELLKGRVTKTENNGWIEFKISNVQFVDRGYYRCSVLGSQIQIYRDYYVEVSDALSRHSQSQPPLPTTIKVLSSSTSLPESTGSVLNQENNPLGLWSSDLHLFVIMSISVIIFIGSVIGVVCFRAFRMKASRKPSDKCDENLCESLKQEAPDMSGIVYTTLDFRAHQKPTEVYANLKKPKTQAGAADTAHAEMVEYSTLAIHQ
ncbi:uncharacterized protein LOC115046689 [Echeneis naucrates]|uniref:uncharacterized protein LOC115046689 n=1 Tax=Echeneis naucrates TaxID=173247 RepID=UPI0011136B8F|nr:uncharacterized protein LOC115046689 [Echeneis naucrates]